VPIPSIDMTRLHAAIHQGHSDDAEYYAIRIARENLGPYREKLFKAYQDALQEIHMLTETLKVVHKEADNRRKYYEVFF
jgi:hypothetical protein